MSKVGTGPIFIQCEQRENPEQRMHRQLRKRQVIEMHQKKSQVGNRYQVGKRALHEKGLQ